MPSADDAVVESRERFPAEIEVQNLPRVLRWFAAYQAGDRFCIDFQFVLPAIVAFRPVIDEEGGQEQILAFLPGCDEFQHVARFQNFRLSREAVLFCGAVEDDDAWYGKWWVWTIAGAAVLGGAATAGYLLSDEDESDGFQAEVRW